MKRRRYLKLLLCLFLILCLAGCGKKTPVIPPSDAPIDHPALVAALRRESAENDGHFFVDTGERGIRAE